MPPRYGPEGNYIYPDGFDPVTGEWLEGCEKPRGEWERLYAEARQRWEAHTKQVQTARAADAVAEPASSSGAPAGATTAPAAAPRAEEPSGTLATDEALAALREKLAGGKS